MALHLFSAHHAAHGLAAVAALTHGLPQLTRQLREEPGVVGTLTLATCNRVELYLDSENDEQQVRAGLARALARADADFEAPALTYRRDRDAMHHLFRVSAGLDSMVIGDREVAAQVRASVRAARAHRVALRDLGVVADQALRTARLVRRGTHLGARGRSVVSVALDLVRRDWAHTQVAVLGTGSYAGAVVAELARRGCVGVRVHSASGRATQFAATRPGVQAATGSVVAACEGADVVIACRGAGRFEIDLATARVLVADRSTDLTLIDLAVGHDIDPAVADLEGIGLLDLDTVGRHAPETSRRDMARAEQIVNDQVAHTMDLLRGRAMDPAVVALRDAVAAMVADEVDRLPAGRDLSPEEAAQALRRLAARLVHQPSVRARQAAVSDRTGEYLAALLEVWGPEVICPQDPARGIESCAEAAIVQVAPLQ